MNQNLFWCIVGMVGGAILGFLTNYYFYFKGLSKKVLKYEIDTVSIISSKINQIEGMEVKYKTKEIKDLYFSTIIIKNIGNTIIKSQDIVSSCPITVLTHDQFLNSKIERVESNFANKNVKYKLLINQMNNCIKIDFDYIPKKSIIKFSLFHTGNIYLNGDLYDGEILSLNKLKTKKMMLRRIILFIIEIIILLISILILFLVLTSAAST